jgi:uncharacterized protein YjiS (DUF1127 family)
MGIPTYNEFWHLDRFQVDSLHAAAEFPMKLRSFFYALAASVLVLLLISASGFYWITSHSPLALLRGGQVASPTAAMFVPKQAPVLVSLLVNPDRLESFRQVVARPGERRRSRAELEQLKQSLLANTGLDYRRDVQPWLGDEITLAITSSDIDRDDQNGQQLGYLLAVATQDPERSREFLQLFWQKRAIAGTDLVFEQYKGVKLIYGNSKEVKQLKGKRRQSTSSPLTLNASPSLASAVVGNQFVLFANHPKVLRDAVNNVQAPDLSLRDSSTYQQALATLPKARIGLTFLNLPTLATLIGNEAPSPLYESEAIALELTRKGLIAETALLATADTAIPTRPVLAQPVGALNYLPAATALAFSGSNLNLQGYTTQNQQWLQVTNGFAGFDATSRLVNQPLADLKTHWGIELPQDIFDWVQGEYALGLLPRATPVGSDWILVAQKSADTAEPALERLDAIAKQQGLSVGPLTLGNQQITTWTKLATAATQTAGSNQEPMTLKAQVKGVHATVDNYEIFTSSVEAMGEALQAPQNPLLTQRKFQQAIAPLPQPNEGYVYLDWLASQPVLERQLPILKFVELSGQPLFSYLRSLSASSYSAETGIRRGAVFVRLSAPAKSASTT